MRKDLLILSTQILHFTNPRFVRRKDEYALSLYRSYYSMAKAYFISSAGIHPSASLLNTRKHSCKHKQFMKQQDTLL